MGGKNMSNRNRSLNESGLHSDTPMWESNTRYGSTLSPMQTPGDLAPDVTQGHVWFDDGAGNWIIMMSPSGSSEDASTISYDPPTEQRNSDHGECLLLANISTKLNDGQHLESESPQRPLRPHINLFGIPDGQIAERRQTQRRRDQNKRSQQAYRERRTQYVVDLTSKVKAIDEQVRSLQLENRELIQRLCELRTQNHSLDASRKSLDASADNLAFVEISRTLDESEAKDNIPLSDTELESLYEPYLAVWNLLSSHLTYSSQPRDVAAVMERLKTMAIERIEEVEEADIAEPD